MKRRALLTRLAASLAVACALLALLFVAGGVDLADVPRTMARLEPEVYALALGLHLLTTALRAARFQCLVPRAVRPSFPQAVAVSAAHNMAAYLLPLRAGEAALILYLRLESGTPGGVALAALLVSRFLDAATLCAGLAAACFGVRGFGPAPQWMGGAALGSLALAGLFLGLSLRGDLLVRGVGRGLRRLGVERWAFGVWLLARSSGLAVALRAASGGRRLGLAALLSIPLWFTVFGFFALLARAFGIPEHLSFLARALGASLATIANLLPVNAAAGAGTQELGWVTGFHALLGVDEGVALTSGIGVHLVQLFNIVLLGVLAHLAMGVLPRRPAPAAE